MSHGKETYDVKETYVNTPHLHEQLTWNFSTVPQGRFFLKNHLAKFFLRGP